MRIRVPLILGAGPAGCAAAITLARGGAAPLLLDRDPIPGDAICGGFLSWETVARLAQLGVDLPALGPHPVHELAVFAGAKVARAALPRTAFGLSRRALDTAMRATAVAAGTEFRVAKATAIEGAQVNCADESYLSEALFLATGKHDVRGIARPRDNADPALGLRIRVPASPTLDAMLDGRIELHLFAGGYAGIVRQEGNTGVNICLAVRKSLLARAGGDPLALLDALADRHPSLSDRLTGDWRAQRCDTIGNVPYGWIACETVPGVFRLGDQAAVIPSLAGEGIDIAVASGMRAAQAFLQGDGAPRYQRDFARAARRPVRAATLAWHAGEHRVLGPLAARVLGFAPAFARSLMHATRLG